MVSANLPLNRAAPRSFSGETCLSTGVVSSPVKEKMVQDTFIPVPKGRARTQSLGARGLLGSSGRVVGAGLAEADSGSSAVTSTSTSSASASFASTVEGNLES
jgi:hypothetical protein